MKEAIQKAIEGGWIPFGEKITEWEFYDGILKVFALDGKKHRLKEYYLQEQIILDPFFWQALGKVEGWDTSNMKQWWQKSDIRDKITLLDRWENEMHSFIDHIAGGGDVDSFFKKLLKA